LAFSLDEQGGSPLRAFASRMGMNYPVVTGSLRMRQDFGGKAIPTTLVVDRQGTIVARHVGFAPREAFEQEVKPLL
jgi:hypothetical protein